MNLFYLTPLILQKSIWPQIRAMLLFFTHLEVNGLENLEGLDANVIFAANHTSELDPILVPASLPFFSRFSPVFYVTLARSEYNNSGWRQAFYGGFIFKLLGGHPAYLGLKDYEKSLINHTKLLSAGKNLLIFPEGKITREGNGVNGIIQKAHGGATYLSETMGRPIVPIGISGVFNMSNADFFCRRRKVIVNFGKPIYKEELRSNISQGVDSDGGIYKEEAQYVMKKVEDLITGYTQLP